jgi:hypothetical protein
MEDVLDVTALIARADRRRRHLSAGVRRQLGPVLGDVPNPAAAAGASEGPSIVRDVRRLSCRGGRDGGSRGPERAEVAERSGDRHFRIRPGALIPLRRTYIGRSRSEPDPVPLSPGLVPRGCGSINTTSSSRFASPLKPSREGDFHMTAQSHRVTTASGGVPLRIRWRSGGRSLPEFAAFPGRWLGVPLIMGLLALAPGEAAAQQLPAWYKAGLEGSTPTSPTSINTRISIPGSRATDGRPTAAGATRSPSATSSTTSPNGDTRTCSRPPSPRTRRGSRPPMVPPR